MVKVEEMIRKALAQLRPLKMTKGDWKIFREVLTCHICDKQLMQEHLVDSKEVLHPQMGFQCGQSHVEAFKKVLGQDPRIKPKTRDGIKSAQQHCLFRKHPLLKEAPLGCDKRPCHIIGKFCGAAQSTCSSKLRVNSKTDPIPVVIHDFMGYYTQYMSNQYRYEVKCITNSMTKYISWEDQDSMAA